MALPKYDEMFPDVLKVLSDGKGKKVDTIRKEISQVRGLSQEELSELLPSNSGTVFNNRANWALQYLFQAGFIERPRRGVYQLSQEGKNYIEKNGYAITTDDLRKIDAFNEFQSRSRQGKTNEVIEDSPNTSLTPNKNEPIGKSKTPVDFPLDETPEVLIDGAQKLLHRKLSEDLMQAIMDMDPVFFEKLVLDLLIAMGYGGKDNANIIHTPASGDGGIDGLIKEDELGLDYIYVQAKRWAHGNQVSRPEVQKFVGALVGEGARKGVFITTSDFSVGAKEYARSNNAGKVVLINGAELTRLMITYGVGVSTVYQYKIQKVDMDYFIQE